MVDSKAINRDFMIRFLGLVGQVDCNECDTNCQQHPLLMFGEWLYLAALMHVDVPRENAITTAIGIKITAHRTRNQRLRNHGTWS